MKCIRAEGACRLFQFRVEVRDGIANDADDDGGVVEDMGDENKDKG